MKPTGPHRSNRLTDKAIKAIKEPGRYPDGDSLYLVADHQYAKRWVLRITVQGRRRDIGLGSYKHVSLAEARAKAFEYRRVARAGQDPLLVLRDNEAVPSFEELARSYYDLHKAQWRNPKHRQQWINTLEQYAFPTIGRRPVNQISTPDIVALLSPIWFEKRETARRVKQRIAAVLDDAKGKGHLHGENPVAGVSASLKDGKQFKPKHHRAIDYRDLPALVAELRSDNSFSMTRLALEWTVLTAARTIETIGAKWDEIDEKKQVWIIPGERMKAGVEHRVPLADRCLEILDQVRPITSAGPFVFEGRRPKRPMSDMTMLTLLKRHGIDATVHGMRSTFRDWCSEQTSFPHAAVEKCIAHTIKDKAEAAYARSDLLDRRREIMDAWEKYVGSGEIVRTRDD